MTPEQLITLDIYIRQNRSFAMYRLPHEETVHFIMQTSGPLQRIDSIEALNGQQGFVIAPFRITEDQPAVIIRPDITEFPAKVTQEDFFPEQKEEPEKIESILANLENYRRVFDKFREPLQKKQFDKIVLSRKKVIPRPAGFSPAQALQKALKQYTRSYVYLCHTPYTGTWLGSTPEMLLSGEKNEWHTVALAGTVPLQKGKLPEVWNDKNREEQQMVAYYIVNRLAGLGITPDIHGPYTVRAAHLAHLKTDFQFTLPDTRQLGNLLHLLHPTPAIAGIPKEHAIDFILRNEGYNRKLYSGFLGNLQPEGKTDLYVNLRCMQIHEQTLVLYAGSGLLETSSPEEEWLETEDKLQTMNALIQ